MSARREILEQFDPANDTILGTLDDDTPEAASHSFSERRTHNGSIQGSLLPIAPVANAAPSRCQSVPPQHTESYAALKESPSLSATLPQLGPTLPEEKRIPLPELRGIGGLGQGSIAGFWSEPTLIGSNRTQSTPSYQRKSDTCWSASTLASSFEEFVPLDPAHPKSIIKPNSDEGQSCSSSPSSSRRPSSSTQQHVQSPRAHTSTRTVTKRPLAEMNTLPWSPYNLRFNLAKSSPSTAHLIVCENPYIPHERLLYLLATLDPRKNPARVNNFFNGLDIIIGDLQSEFPNDVIVNGLIQALERLDLLHQLNFARGSADINQWTSAAADYHPNTCTSTSKDESNGVTNSSDDTNPSPPDQDQSNRSNRFNARQNAASNGREGRGATRLSRTRGRHMRDENRLLDCPIRKHCQVHNRSPVCEPDGWPNMWSVTQHLKTRTHRSFLPFIILCRHCYFYVNDEGKYQTVHKEGRCPFGHQPRGSRVAEHWQSLYRTLYPESEWIPSPWINEQAHPNVTSPMDHDAIQTNPQPNTTAPTLEDFSFLGDVFTGSCIEDLAMPLYAPIAQLPSQHLVTTTEQQAEAAATDLFTSMFQDFFRRPGDLHDHYMDQLMRQTHQMDARQRREFSIYFRNRAATILRRLQSDARAGISQTVPTVGMSAADNTAIPICNAPSYPPTFPAHHFDNAWLGNLPVPESMLDGTSGLFHPSIAQNVAYETFQVGAHMDDHLDYPNDLHIGTFMDEISSFSTPSLRSVVS